MTIRGFRQGSVAHLAAVVTAALFAVGTPMAWAGPATSARPATALEVQSQPSGAAVYVDGQLKGATPVAVDGLASGDHTVRLVKDGFLENSRVVSVPLAGRSVHVSLTPTRMAPRAALMQVEPEEPPVEELEGGGGGKKWIFIGAGAALLAGGTVAAVLLAGGKKAKVDSVSASQSTGILQGATSVSFSAETSGEGLSYRWDFGDGQSSTAASPTHVFAASGRLTVTLTVTDSDDNTASGSTTVTVGDLAGPWRGQIAGGFSYTCNFTHVFAAIAGTCTDGARTWTIGGAVAPPLSVDLTASRTGYRPWYMRGEATGDFNMIAGTTSGLVDSSGNPVTPGFTLTRQ